MVVPELSRTEAGALAVQLTRELDGFSPQVTVLEYRTDGLTASQLLSIARMRQLPKTKQAV